MNVHIKYLDDCNMYIYIFIYIFVLQYVLVGPEQFFNETSLRMKDGLFVVSWTEAVIIRLGSSARGDFLMFNLSLSPEKNVTPVSRCKLSWGGSLRKSSEKLHIASFNFSNILGHILYTFGGFFWATFFVNDSMAQANLERVECSIYEHKSFHVMSLHYQ